jgi:hypothetical protein
MLYYIFLKSLRGLEKFRKHPHIKIPPKSPCTNFQSLGIFNNPNFILKSNSLQILTQLPNGPIWPFGLPDLFFLLLHQSGVTPLPPASAASQHRPGLTRHGAVAVSSAPHLPTISPSSPLHSVD